jgi:hypothetical protein
MSRMSTAQLRQEVARLRERALPAKPVRSEAERFSSWQARARIRRNQEAPRSVKVARSRIAWLRLVGKLRDFSSSEQLIEDIMTGPDGSGGLQPPEERSRILVEREVYSAIRRKDPGLGHLEELPGEWAEMFAAADEWRERMLAVPIGTLARWVIATRRLVERGAEEEIDALSAEHLGPYGIDAQLLERVVGPDRAVLSSEETGWMIHAPLSDDFCSQWAFKVGEETRKIDEREGGK